MLIFLPSMYILGQLKELNKRITKMTDVSFEDLLNRAEQLTADVDTGTELPRIQRNLPQLAEASQRLLSRTIGGIGETSDVKA